MIILTLEEHDEWIHLCDKAGRELLPDRCKDCDMRSVCTPEDCKKCDLGPYCRSEHSIRGVDFIPMRL